MNSVNLIGNLCANPILKQTQNGTAVASLSIAVNEVVKGEKKAHFFQVTAWNKVAESCSNYLVKGNKVGIEGSLRQDRWEDKEGKPQSRVTINAHRVEFLTPKTERIGNGDGEIEI